MKFTLYLLALLPFFTIACSPQVMEETFSVENNQIDSLMHSKAMSNVYQALNQVKEHKKESLTIMHIGDSHIEIGQFSGEIKKQLIEEYGKGEIGWEFPYQLFNPQSVKVFPMEAKGNWKKASIKQGKTTIPLGVTGLAFYLKDSLGELHFKKRIKDESFTKIEFLHYMPTNDFLLNCDIAKISTRKITENTGITTLIFDKPTDEVVVNFNCEQIQPIIYALRINANLSHGITYHKFGVAGSTIDQFINNTILFQEQLSYVKPELLIISLGTNDSYIDSLNVPRITKQLTSFIQQIHTTVPNTTILFTTAPDTKYQNRRPQRITEINTIIRNQVLADNSLVLWDLNHIMGGDNSIEEWCKRFYVNSDSLHFNPRGYRLQGELFMKAFRKAQKN
jgi:lysophospholipase L1-like esterase